MLLLCEIDISPGTYLDIKNKTIGWVECNFEWIKTYIRLCIHIITEHNCRLMRFLNLIVMQYWPED